MKLELIEELGGVRIAKYTYEDPDGMTGETALYASYDGQHWARIDGYTVEMGLTGPIRISDFGPTALATAMNAVLIQDEMDEEQSDADRHHPAGGRIASL